MGQRLRRLARPRLRVLLICAALVALVVAPPTSAQDATSDPSAAQYDPPIPDPGGAAADGTVTGGEGGDGGLNSEIGSLPFTGMDLLIVAGVALVLTGTGFALRRLSTPRGPTL